MKLAIVGVTGMVGQEMLKVLAEMSLPITTLIPVASKKTAGTKIIFGGQEHTVVDIEEALRLKPDVALFSAGGEISLEWAPQFAKIGCRVVDNSSAFRMDE